MASAMIVGGALANCGGDCSTDELLEFLSEREPDFALYRLVPKSGVRASLDWQGILGTGADLIAYGSLFWSAYQQFIVPRLATGGSGITPFLLITLRGPSHLLLQFQLGGQYSSREEFLRDFRDQACALREAPEGPSDLELEWEFSQQDDWVRFGDGRRRHS